MARTPLVINPSDSVAATIAKILDFINAAATPTPTPAPVFDTLPSISPAGGLVGDTFTATDAEVSNGAVVSRRWLLGGLVIGTGLTVLVKAAGTLVLENTAVGIGGETIKTSEAVLVRAASTTLKPLALFGVNTGKLSSYASIQNMFVNRMHSIQPFQADGGGTVTLNSRGMPTATNAASGAIFSYAAADNPAKHPGVSPRHVLICRKAWNAYVQTGTNEAATLVSRTDLGNGMERSEWDVSAGSFNTGAGSYSVRFILQNINANPDDGTSEFAFYRKDMEELYQAGRIFTDDALAMFAGRSIRTLDLVGTNGPQGGITDYSQWTSSTTLIQFIQGDDASASRMSVGFLCALANEALARNPTLPTALWLPIPWGLSDAGVRAMIRDIEKPVAAKGQGGLDPSIPLHLEYANEYWSSGNAGGAASGYVNALYQPPVVAHAITGYDAFPNGGARAAQVMAVALDEATQKDRIKPVISGQNIYAPALVYSIQGVRAWMDQLRVPGSRFYNAKFAALYDSSRPLSQLFQILSVANYNGGGLADAANQSAVEALADKTDDSGLATAFLQLDSGGQLPTPPAYGTANMVAKFAETKAIADAENLIMVAYEGGQVNELFPSPKVQAFIARMDADPRKRTSVLKHLQASYAAGFQSQNWYVDSDNPGSGYNLQLVPWDPNGPAALGAKDFENNPPALPAPLAVTISQVGTAYAGNSLLLIAHITGGRGFRKAVWAGLDGSGLTALKDCAGGVLVAGTYAIKVAVTDEQGGTASATVNLTVKIPVPIAATHFFMLVPQENFNGQTLYPAPGTGRGGVRELYPLNADGTKMDRTGAAVTCPGGAYDGGQSPAQTLDGDETTAFLSNGGSANQSLIYAAPTAIKPAAFSVGAMFDPYGPALSWNGIDIYASTGDANGPWAQIGHLGVTSTVHDAWPNKGPYVSIACDYTGALF